MRTLQDALTNLEKPEGYYAQLKDSRWVELARSKRREQPWCNSCRSNEKALTVHHANYRTGAKAWEYSHQELVCLCWDCHKLIEEAIKKLRSTAARCNASNIARISLALDAAIKSQGEFKVMIKLSEML
jgi:hypothetical protein